MALPQVQNQGGLGDIAQLLQQLGPLFGTGKTSGSSSSSTSGKAGDLSQTDDLIQQILGSVNDGNLDTLTQNVLEKAKQTFAPANISSSAAGIRGYSDTVHTEMQNQAMAKATAEAMSVRLQAQGQAQKTAGGLVESKLQTNKTVANQQQSSTGASPAGKGAALITPALLLANQFSKYKKNNPTEKPIDGSLKDEAGDNDLNASYGGTAESVDSSGATAFPPQDFGNDSIILNDSLSEIPPPLDFGDAQPLPIDGSLPADSISADAPSEDIPVDVPADDVPADTFSDFNLDDIDFFADGGIVQPGARGKPTSYDENAQIRNTVNAPTLAANSTNQSQQPIIGKKGRFSTGDTGFDPNQLLLSGDSSPADAVASAPPGATPPGGLGLGLGLAANAVGLAGPVGLAVAIGLALANSGIGATIGGNIGTDTLGNDLGNDTLGTPTGVGDDNADGNASNAATAGESGAPAGSSDGTPGGDTGDTGDSGDGGSAGAGDGGGSGDGGEYDGGIQEADNLVQKSGIDKKLIHVTPGEAVLPVDTVQALGEDTIEALIAATHTPLKRRANGRR